MPFPHRRSATASTTRTRTLAITEWVVSPSAVNSRESQLTFPVISVGVVAFLASIGFLAGEYMFEQMSSVKSRKHYVLGDMGFHGLWALMFFIGFCYLTNQWSASAEPPIGYSSTSVKSAIIFCLFGSVSCVSRAEFRRGSWSFN